MSSKFKFGHEPDNINFPSPISTTKLIIYKVNIPTHEALTRDNKNVKTSICV